MAPIPKFYRFWCKSCQDFTLQNGGETGDCRSCGCITKEYKLSDVPIDKILEQRERYRYAKGKKFENLMGTYLGNSNNPFEKEWPQPEIVECDAGQNVIDDKRKEIYEQEALKLKTLKEESLQFIGTNRNDQCPCNSGKKYKKCCLQKYENI